MVARVSTWTVPPPNAMLKFLSLVSLAPVNCKVPAVLDPPSSTALVLFPKTPASPELLRVAMLRVPDWMEVVPV